jgi:hypothetical protein
MKIQPKAPERGVELLHGNLHFLPLLTKNSKIVDVHVVAHGPWPLIVEDQAGAAIRYQRSVPQHLGQGGLVFIYPLGEVEAPGESHHQGAGAREDHVLRAEHLSVYS